jgi:hypothetical protein
MTGDKNGVHYRGTENLEPVKISETVRPRRFLKVAR